MDCRCQFAYLQKSVGLLLILALIGSAAYI